MTAAATLHATCVAWDAKAVIIIGRSGAGKSALGLQLMALGCVLVADDRVCVTSTRTGLIASCPKTIVGLIEARGVGILTAKTTAQADVQLIVDLDKTTTQRLPERRVMMLHGHKIPLIHRAAGDHFVPAILQLLKAGWSER